MLYSVFYGKIPLLNPLIHCARQGGAIGFGL